eukprot:symbB.v1.2.016341.t1/scaffold1222.1/size194531/15
MPRKLSSLHQAGIHLFFLPLFEDVNVVIGLEDAHALRPGQLVATVQDEGDDQVLVFEAKIRGQLAESLILQEAEASEAEAPDGHLGAYKPPRIAQVEYTGDHISMQERAEKELDRKKARLERSEFMRSLREEFTDAPKEIGAEERSARAEKAARMLREQEEFEEDTLTRVKVKKADLRKQKQALREGRATSGGAVSIFDVTSDFGQIMRGASSAKGGKGKPRRGGVLQEYEEAKQKVHGLRESVASAMDGARGRKRSSGAGQMKGCLLFQRPNKKETPFTSVQINNDTKMVSSRQTILEDLGKLQMSGGINETFSFSVSLLSKTLRSASPTIVELAFVVPVRHFTKASVSRRATLR